VLPSALVEVHDSRRARARFAARFFVLAAGDARRRARERLRVSPGGDGRAGGSSRG
jgi:hypothetical protein